MSVHFINFIYAKQTDKVELKSNIVYIKYVKKVVVLLLLCYYCALSQIIFVPT